MFTRTVDIVPAGSGLTGVQVATASLVLTRTLHSLTHCSLKGPTAGTTLTATLEFSDSNGTAGSTLQYDWYRNRRDLHAGPAPTLMLFRLMTWFYNVFPGVFTDDDGFVEEFTGCQIGRLSSPTWSQSLDPRLTGGPYYIGKTLIADFADQNGIGVDITAGTPMTCRLIRRLRLDRARAM